MVCELVVVEITLHSVHTTLYPLPYDYETYLTPHSRSRLNPEHMTGSTPELVLGTGALYGSHDGGNVSHRGGHAHGGAHRTGNRSHDGGAPLRTHGSHATGPIAILPHALFPTGRYNPKPTNETVWVHANWIKRRTRESTNTAKVARLRSHKVWHAGCPPARSRNSGSIGS